MNDHDNERVIAAVVKDNKIYGITDEGSLAHFDEDLGKWVQRCDAEVLCADKTSALRKTYIDPVVHRPGSVHSDPVKAPSKHFSGVLIFAIIMLVLSVISFAINAWLVFGN